MSPSACGETRTVLWPSTENDWRPFLHGDHLISFKPKVPFFFLVYEKAFFDQNFAIFSNKSCFPPKMKFCAWKSKGCWKIQCV